MEQDQTTAKKDSIIKTLAITGFIGLIIIISWVAIQLVQVLPSAFTSLASLADSVYNYQPANLQISSSKTDLAHKESFTLSWTDLERNGSYTFSYQCGEGLSLDMRDSLGNIKALTCDAEYNLGTVTSADFIVLSERARFADLKYRIGFIPSGRTETNGEAIGSVTVVNAAINLANTATSTPITGNPTATSSTSTVVIVPPTTPSTSTPAKPKPEVTPTKPATATTPTTKPVVVERPVYGIPVSDPNGSTDLLVTFGGTGILDGQVFRNTGVIDNDSTGAIQFVVKNTGTKTSNAWTYVVKLPNGETFTSKDQTALKPNERAVLTIGFPVDGLTGAKRYSVTAEVADDATKSNNRFESVVAITD
jgi:hypothetical protein